MTNRFYDYSKQIKINIDHSQYISTLTTPFHNFPFITRSNFEENDSVVHHTKANFYDKGLY